MTAGPGSPPATAGNDAGGHNTLTGIMFKIVSVAVFVGMQTCIKAAGTVPAGQIVFFRSFFAIFPIIAFLAFRKELGTAFTTNRPFNHIARGLVGVCAMGLGFFALTRLPLPEAITLNYAQPLLVVVFSSIFLGEAIRVYRWSAVAVGLVGVLIISWPELTLLSSDEALDDQEVLGVIAALVAAAISAVAMLLVRNLVQSERTATIVLWFSVTASVMSLLSLPFGWQALTPLQAALLVAAGFCGGLGQILMTAAYRHAEASVVAPFEYTSMILGVVVGYLVFGDVATLHMLAGGLIVVAAGIFIIWRERQLGLERTRTRKASLPEG
ncbi:MULTISPECIES: DMT family transporter [unclassified Mesorhizobium]|uniref:DMT family transporter n=3 Tax=Mesorhizobium TaxID=68287 RepID=UPI000FD447AF|nr:MULTISPECIES: DMT family transporter [unclassified Mesorhizobium]RVD19069.1 DMT family transporter [Mesorhizobium sp. M7A.F.Ca.ET.027.02.1.1]RWP10781.1 MAG: DMT family transporter [Mesorhizobium sp.]RWP83774.1 MAG: DMT family transporter [Mesorhizobium sp.]RWP93127.1 MAG: DMT family transporter [Mesorhizobium sp.]RWQ25186.1 MAG: DMT family transporter [Mesorhizobium sp.]